MAEAEAEPVEPGRGRTEVPERPSPTAATARPNAITSNRPRQKYALPLPVRTFPLPAFYPSNPLSLVHLAVAWAGQVLQRPAALPAQTVHTGNWCAATRAVHVSDPASMNDLWCQGFFGKGSLSRSEPSWLTRERERQRDRDKDKDKDKTSEQRTNRRREERADSKWERGRAALEAIERRRHEEAAEAAVSAKTEPLFKFKPPVGPRELLALPNSQADLDALEQSLKEKDRAARADGAAHVNGTAAADALPDKPQKSVRFSATVESTTFAKSDPPSPSLGETPPAAASATAIANKEHLQLAPEEAFFLAYAVGALRVVDDAGHALSHQALFRLFCAHAAFPPSLANTSTGTGTSTFLAHYSVYHHFRSLGWTPRHGIKFGVDWLLYGKGPALDHAEFGVMVMAEGGGAPASASASAPAAKTWHWLHSVNRVLSTVYKSMVLVYVDESAVPGMDGDGAGDMDVTALLRAVKIRTVMVRRWSSNRNRD